MSSTTVFATAAPIPWSSPGNGAEEPSTPWDTADRMFWWPNNESLERVYFNGFILQGTGAVTPVGHYDANLRGGTVMSPVENRFGALLGFWRDCNKDGYIGARAVPATGSIGSFSTYPRAAFTIDETICPPGTPYNPTNALTNSPNGIIDEFRWIGPQLVAPSPQPMPNCIPPANAGVAARCVTQVEDPYDVADPNTKVWVDWNYPGGRHIYHQGLTAHPPGTYDDSDGSLQYVDDATGRALSAGLGSTWATKPNVGACDEPPVLLAGPNSRLPVADRGTCGTWPLMQAERILNDEDSANRDEDHPEALVQIFDTRTNSGGSTSDPCDDGVDQTIAGRRIALPNAEPRVHPNFLVQGSISGTYTNVNNANVTSMNGRCTTADTTIGNLEATDLDAEFTHRLPDDTMAFTPDQRYRILAAQGFDYAPLDIAGTGVRSHVGSVGADHGAWYGRFGWTGRPPRTGFGSTTNAYATFYADVACDSVRPTGGSCPTNNTAASAAVSLPGRSQDKFTYGTDFCSSFTTGAPNVNPANDWDCSVTTWQAKRAQDLEPRRPIIGDKYDLRDVDCYDNQIAWVASVRAGIADCSVAP